MINLSQIHPVTEFVRNYKTLLDRIKATGSPEVLTVNGKPEYVILDAASYQEIAALYEQQRFRQAVAQGIADMQAGRGQPHEAAFAAIRANLDL